MYICKVMFRKTILIINCIILCVLLDTQNDFSSLPDYGSEDNNINNSSLLITSQETDSEVSHPSITSVGKVHKQPAKRTASEIIAKENTSQVRAFGRFPYIFQSQHLTCQQTRAGTLINATVTDPDSKKYLWFGIGEFFEGYYCHA